MGKDSNVIIPMDVIQAEEWTQFNGTPESKVWWLLYGSIIRAECNSGRIRLYEDYYCKGKLAARWSQVDIAKKLKMSQSYVSKIIAKLHKLGVIQLHKKNIDNITINIYVMGYKKNHEHIFLFESILKKVKERKFEKTLKKLGARVNENNVI